MTSFNRRRALTLTLFALTLLPLGSAHAMGGSGRPTHPAAAKDQVLTRIGAVEQDQKQMDTRLQKEMESLRRELNELKARMATAQNQVPGN